MKPFDYAAPKTIEEALALLHNPVRILAGGTDLLIELRKPQSTLPQTVVDISHLSGLHGITDEGETIRIGPLTTHAEIERSAFIQRHAAMLSSSAANIGSPQIRNRGTVGGNIMNAATCADTVPPLVALDATVTLRSDAGARTLSLSELFIAPYKTVARSDELLTEIRFIKPSQGSRSAFIKLGRRNAVSISRLSVAAILRLSNEKIVQEARIVPGATFPTWQRIAEAERVLVGKRFSFELATQAGTVVAEQMIALTGRRWSTEYKEPVIAVLVRRALEECAR